MKDRNPVLADLLSKLSPTGRNPEQAAELGVCTQCAGPAVSFKDELSKKEYGITGFCQTCQDKFEEKTRQWEEAQESKESEI